ncbi:MAG: hypothetical protein FWG85_01230 [Bacteroidetes bacterium]|nr:hypothetical protein [Bacteroidota bacterium]
MKYNISKKKLLIFATTIAIVGSSFITLMNVILNTQGFKEEINLNYAIIMFVGNFFIWFICYSFTYYISKKSEFKEK